MSNDNQKQKSGITPLSFMGSMFAGWFGVQSKANRERDFKHGKVSHFFIGGVIFAILLVLFLIGIVQVVVPIVGS